MLTSFVFNIGILIIVDVSLLTIVRTDRTCRHLSYSIGERRDYSIDVTSGQIKCEKQCRIKDSCYSDK